MVTYSKSIQTDVAYEEKTDKEHNQDNVIAEVKPVAVVVEKETALEEPIKPAGI